MVYSNNCRQRETSAIFWALSQPNVFSVARAIHFPFSYQIVPSPPDLYLFVCRGTHWLRSWSVRTVEKLKNRHHFSFFGLIIFAVIRTCAAIGLECYNRWRQVSFLPHILLQLMFVIKWCHFKLQKVWRYKMLLISFQYIKNSYQKTTARWEIYFSSHKFYFCVIYKIISFYVIFNLKNPFFNVFQI